MPPRSPIFNSAAFARAVSGRTPIAKITKAAGRIAPLANVTVCSSIVETPSERCSSTPCSSISFETKVAISGSSGAKTCGVASTSEVFIPRCMRFSAISTPMNPPPITTALAGFSPTRAVMRSTSSTVRRVIALSTPGIGGTTGDAPGLRINLS
ncbi:unannotated protein [freshwater metagenome]|uniref:Unannotated protein n=1 Tax=freshwater metagenome TaxID=449393 RepID=A0A6J7NNF4_9ZZZZ